MARIRSVKPDFFRHSGLYEAERDTGLPLRLAFAGLWTASDREGRFSWKPKELKLDCLPHDDIDFSRVLDALVTRGFIVRYASAGKEYGYIPSWHDHQVINNREAASVIPPPSEDSVIKQELTRAPRVDDASPTPLVQVQGEGKGREGKDAASSDAHLSGVNLAEPTASGEAELFRRGKEILKGNSGGLIKQLLKAKGGSVPLARAAIEQASTKGDPREYIGRVVRGPQQERHSISDPLAGII